MDMIGRIRRLHTRKKKSEREISRITGLSRNTVAKWLHGEVDGPPKYRRGEQPNKLTVFHEALKQALKADARRPRHERRTAKALYAEIKLSEARYQVLPFALGLGVLFTPCASPESSCPCPRG